jgi:hypothetical protein
MRTLNINFDDKDFEKLEKSKGAEKTWRDFVMELTQ